MHSSGGESPYRRVDICRRHNYHQRQVKRTNVEFHLPVPSRGRQKEEAVGSSVEGWLVDETAMEPAGGFLLI